MTARPRSDQNEENLKDHQIPSLTLIQCIHWWSLCTHKQFLFPIKIWLKRQLYPPNNRGTIWTLCFGYFSHTFLCFTSNPSYLSLASLKILICYVTDRKKSRKILKYKFFSLHILIMIPCFKCVKFILWNLRYSLIESWSNSPDSGKKLMSRLIS